MHNTATSTKNSQSYLAELRLFLEDICCDLCLFDAAGQHDRRLESVKIDREYVGNGEVLEPVWLCHKRHKRSDFCRSRKIAVTINLL